MKWYGKYGRKLSWNVKWYGKYGGKVSWIVKRYGKWVKKTYYYSKEKARESDVTSGHVPEVTSVHLPSNDVISGDGTPGYILKTNNPFLFVLGTSIL